MTAIKNIKLIAEQASKGASLTEKSNSSKSNKRINIYRSNCKTP